MEQREIEFIKKILKATLGIDMFYVKAPYDMFDFSCLDYHLRQTIWSNIDYRSIFLKPFSNPKEKTLYCMTDIFDVHYAIFPIVYSELENIEYLIFGPYLTDPINSFKINQAITANNLSNSMVYPLKTHYCSLPIVDNTKIISSINVLAEYIYHSTTDYTIEFVSESGNSIDVTLDFMPYPELSLTMKILEKRYVWENQLMECISKGNRREAINMLKEMPSKMEPRHNDLLRDAKNACIILNTLFRKAAENGVVHPVYLDDISKRFAIKIELTTSLKQTKDLILEMVRKYCILVENQSLKDYSPQIRKAINYINLNLGEPLSLKYIAEELSVNPSYLSNLFKKEVETTITEYINKSRVKMALKLLNSSDMQVQNISWYVGINDVNYFTKVFKKVIGMTPSEYRIIIKNGV